ncbi:MAG: ribosome silencing factor [Kiritimatiellia bacterium]
MVERIKEILENKKANDLVVLDVRERSTMTDWLVVASGMSKSHVKALYEDVLVQLKHEGVSCYRHAGEVEGGWLVLDYLNVVVHVFVPEVRDYYQIEDLWQQAPIAVTPKAPASPVQEDEEEPKPVRKTTKAAAKKSTPRPSAKKQFEGVAKRVKKAPAKKTAVAKKRTVTRRKNTDT